MCCGHAGFARPESMQVGLMCMQPGPLLAGSNQLAFTIEWQKKALSSRRKCHLSTGLVPM